MIKKASLLLLTLLLTCNLVQLKAAGGNAAPRLASNGWHQTSTSGESSRETSSGEMLFCLTTNALLLVIAILLWLILRNSHHGHWPKVH